jgi:hypothetical protein
MKLLLALLLISAPLAAQTNQNVIVNVVVTLVPSTATSTGASSSSSAGTGSISNITTGTSSTSTVSTGSTGLGSTGTTSGPGTGCVNFYPDAAKAMGDVSALLVQARQLYASALASGAINQSTFDSGSNTLAGVQLDNADVRDLVRIAGASSMVAQNVTNISSEVAALPDLLGTTATLHNSLSTLVQTMQTSLSESGYLASTSTCPATVQ